MMECYPEPLLLLFLFAGAAADVRKGEISVLLPAAFCGAGILLPLIGGRLSPALLMGCLPGALLLLLGRATCQAVGYGDGMMLLGCGLFLSFFKVVELLMLSALFAGLFAGIQMVCYGKSRAETLPFLPFLLGGYVVLLAFF